MSVQALSWVLDKSKSRLAARLVLLSIANHADQDGNNAWPKIPTIAREAHVSERQAQRAILDLCVLGELLVCLKGGPGQANIYRIRMGGDNLSPGVVTNQTVGGDISDGAIRKNRPEPSKPITPPTPLFKGGADSNTETRFKQPRRNRAERRRDSNLAVNSRVKDRLARRSPKTWPCAQHPESGPTENGNCWACYAESYGYEVSTA